MKMLGKKDTRNTETVEVY